MISVIRDTQIIRFLDIRKDVGGGFRFKILKNSPGPRGFETILTPIFPSGQQYLKEHQIDPAARIRLRKQWEDELFVKAVKEGMTDEH